MKYLALGSWLRETRRAADKSQRDLAQEIHFDATRISHYEHGDDLPSREYLERYIEILKLEDRAPELWTLFEQARRASLRAKTLAPRQAPSDGVLTLPDAWFEQPRGRHLPLHSYFPLEQAEQVLGQVTSQLENTRNRYSICLTGSGGVGKTTLALEAATRSSEGGAFKDVLWHTARAQRDLDAPESLTDHAGKDFEGVLDSIARQFGLEDFGRLDLETKRLVIADRLWAGRYLILLDNLEEWKGEVKAVKLLMEILGKSRLLITSRDRRLGELDLMWMIPVSGLGKADSKRYLQLEANRRGFHLSKTDLHKLGEIHTFTAGIPYALKRVLGRLQEVGAAAALDAVLHAPAPELREFYAYFFAGDWSALTLAARLLWIYLGRLIPGAISRKQLLQHTALADGWNAAIEELDRHFVLEVTTNPETSDAQLALHPLAGQFIEQLPALVHLNSELADYYQAGCIEQAVRGWLSLACADVSILLNTSTRENILYCVAACFQAQRWEDLRSFWEAISTALYEYGFWKEYEDFERMALDAARALGDHPMEGEVYTELGWIAIEKGELAQAETYCRQSLIVFGQIRDYRGIVISYRYLATILETRCQYELAQDALWKLLARITGYLKGAGPELASQLHRQEIAVRASLGMVLMQMGDFVGAERELHYAFTHASLRSPTSQAEAYFDQGLLWVQQSELEKARGFFEDCLAQCKKLNLRSTGAAALFQLAKIEYLEGDGKKARVMAGQAFRIYHTIGAASKEKQVSDFLAHF